MPLWTWDHEENNWGHAKWYRDDAPGWAVIVGSGQSVKEPVEYPPCSLKIVQNLAYRFVKPDIFIAMDKAQDIITKHNAADIMQLDCPKVFRGFFAGEKIGDTQGKFIPNTYWMDVEHGNREHLFLRKGPECKFLWGKCTLVAAIHLALWMGYKKIAFHGCDFGGTYADGRTHDKAIDQLLLEEFKFMKWFGKMAKVCGIETRNLSGDKSRLSELEEYRTT